MSGLAPVRLRVAPEPRPAEAAKPVPAPRRVELVQARTDHEGSLVATVRLGVLDGLVDEVVVSWPAHEDEATEWAACQQLGRLPMSRPSASRAVRGRAVDAVLAAAQRTGCFRVTCHPRAALCARTHDRCRRLDRHRRGRHPEPESARQMGGLLLLPAGGAHEPRERGGGRLRPPPAAPANPRPAQDQAPRWPGHRPAGARLCPRGSPAALCRSYGVPWPGLPSLLDQLVAEAVALTDAYERMLDDLGEVAPGLAPQACWSAGSIATAALRGAGVRAPAETTAGLPRWVLGACPSACHGGLAEALLVGWPLPMGMLDVRGTYPGCFSLLGLTPHLACDHFEAEGVAVAEVLRLFGPDGLRGRLDDRSWWAEVGPLFAEVEPHGEPLPCVWETPERWRSVVAPLDFSGGTLWLHAADLVRPALAGQLPKLRRALRVVAVGTAEGLRPVAGRPSTPRRWRTRRSSSP